MVFLFGGTWGKWSLPLLWLPFLASRRRQEAVWGAVWVWLGYTLVFADIFFSHPASRENYFLLWAAAAGAALAGAVYAAMHVWPVFALFLDGFPRLIRAGVWLSLALLTEWLTVKEQVLVPAFYLTDLGAVFPANLLVRFWQPWAGVWLVGMGVWVLVTWRMKFWGWRWVRWTVLGGVVLALWKQPRYDPLPARDKALVLVAPGVQHDTVAEEYFRRYRQVLAEFIARQDWKEGETLWVVLPEGSFGTNWEAGDFETQARWLALRRWFRDHVRVPVGWMWEGTVRVATGKKRARLFWETPGRLVGHYDKRWLFIFGEKSVVLPPFGVLREPGSRDQKGYVAMGDGVIHVLLCNEGMTPDLLDLDAGVPAVIVVPAQLGWVASSLSIREVVLRYRLTVEATGLPLCTVQRQGALYCIVPAPLYAVAMGNPWAQSPGYLYLPIVLGVPNSRVRRQDVFFFAWILGFFAWWLGGGLAGEGRAHIYNTEGEQEGDDEKEEEGSGTGEGKQGAAFG